MCGGIGSVRVLGIRSRGRRSAGCAVSSRAGRGARHGNPAVRGRVLRLLVRCDEARRLLLYVGGRRVRIGRDDARRGDADTGERRRANGYRCQRGEKGREETHRQVPARNNTDILAGIGGQYRDRTCDPHHVKVMLYR